MIYLVDRDSQNYNYDRCAYNILPVQYVRFSICKFWCLSVALFSVHVQLSCSSKFSDILHVQRTVGQEFIVLREELCTLVLYSTHIINKYDI